MRNDAVGFFWDDTPPPKSPKADKLKRVPPAPVWLDRNYLPGLDEALRFPVELMTIEELARAKVEQQELILDVECYINYFLAVFTNLVTGKVAYVESYEGVPLDTRKLHWLLTNFTLVTFNGIGYDIPICEMAYAGCSLEQMKEASDKIIQWELRGSDVRKSYGAKGLKVDHIDLIEVAPLFGSLKTYAGRMHCPKMQDLPFHPATELSLEQIAIVRWYCVNDTANTAYLRTFLKEQVDLRYTLSNEYKIDLRSKSDAQIAEHVIAAEIQRRTGQRPQKTEIEVGTCYRYRVPPFLQFQSELLRHALGVVARANFVVGESGAVGLPPEIAALHLPIRNSVYRMGIGGIHSSESTIAHHTDEHNILIDKDVTSFYPFIILNQGLFPPHLGPIFLQVYRNIVDRRLAAKAAGNKPVAESLKIVINGSFGKFGSKYSILYAPDFLIQTTITGQLSILMLIERLEMAGIPVVSANTDGIVIKCPRQLHSTMDAIVAQWERDTKYQTEETRYLALYSRDVNNYIAVKQKFDRVTKQWLEQPDGTKCKGAYANPWASRDNLAMRLHKNPTTTICVEGVERFLIDKVPVAETVRSATDIRKFVTVRTVKGGAVKVWDRIPPSYGSPEELLERIGFVKFAEGSWTEESDKFGRYAMSEEKALGIAIERLSIPGDTDYIGKTVRWYYAKDVVGELVYAKSGNKVPRSEGAKPCMVLPDHMPNDVDFDWYIAEAQKILVAVGAVPENATLDGAF